MAQSVQCVHGVHGVQSVHGVECVHRVQDDVGPVHASVAADRCTCPTSTERAQPAPRWQRLSRVGGRSLRRGGSR
jgi:hypothetical protein